MKLHRACKYWSTEKSRYSGLVMYHRIANTVEPHQSWDHIGYSDLED